VAEHHVIKLKERDFGDPLARDLLLQLGPDIVVPVDVLLQRIRFEF